MIYIMSHAKDRMAKGRSPEKNKTIYLMIHANDRTAKRKNREKDKMIYVTSQ
jgi:hypothetical protein